MKKIFNNEENLKSGFVTIIGRPNVGKSTFVNSVVGKKIAIMSPKAHTTRNQIKGIFNDEEAQIVFLDTPGVHKPMSEMGARMVEDAYSTLSYVDAIIYMVSCDMTFGLGEEYIINKLKLENKPVFLAINKVDLLAKEELLPLIELYSNKYDFKGIYPISAKSGDNIKSLLKDIKDELKVGPLFYPKESITDQSEKLIVSEIIREKILYNTEEEIPHSVAVVVEDIRENGNMVEVFATIHVERKSQKGILIGKGGSMLKKIGKSSRIELERMWGMKVYLNNLVKVTENWRSKKIYLDNFLGKNIDG